MTKHTPGPWIAQNDGYTRNQPYVIYSQLASTQCDGEYTDDPVALGVKECDKDLIAAAPEMLEALVAIMHNLGVPQPGYPAPVSHAYNIAKATIAAATGEKE